MDFPVSSLAAFGAVANSFATRTLMNSMFATHAADRVVLFNWYDAGGLHCINW